MCVTQTSKRNEPLGFRNQLEDADQQIVRMIWSPLSLIEVIHECYLCKKSSPSSLTDAIYFVFKHFSTFTTLTLSGSLLAVRHVRHLFVRLNLAILFNLP